jgi:hypothetical protein
MPDVRVTCSALKALSSNRSLVLDTTTGCAETWSRKKIKGSKKVNVDSRTLSERILSKSWQMEAIISVFWWVSSRPL